MASTSTNWLIIFLKNVFLEKSSSKKTETKRNSF